MWSKLIEVCEKASFNNQYFNVKFEFENKKIWVEYILGENFMWEKEAMINSDNDIEHLIFQIEAASGILQMEGKKWEVKLED